MTILQEFNSTTDPASKGTEKSDWTDIAHMASGFLGSITSGDSATASQTAETIATMGLGALGIPEAAAAIPLVKSIVNGIGFMVNGFETKKKAPAWSGFSYPFLRQSACKITGRDGKDFYKEGILIQHAYDSTKKDAEKSLKGQKMPYGTGKQGVQSAPGIVIFPTIEIPWKENKTKKVNGLMYWISFMLGKKYQILNILSGQKEHAEYMNPAETVYLTARKIRAPGGQYVGDKDPKNSWFDVEGIITPGQPSTTYLDWDDPIVLLASRSDQWTWMSNQGIDPRRTIAGAIVNLNMGSQWPPDASPVKPGQKGSGLWPPTKDRSMQPRDIIAAALGLQSLWKFTEPEYNKNIFHQCSEIVLETTATPEAFGTVIAQQVQDIINVVTTPPAQPTFDDTPIDGGSSTKSLLPLLALAVGGAYLLSRK